MMHAILICCKSFAMHLFWSGARTSDAPGVERCTWWASHALPRSAEPSSHYPTPLKSTPPPLLSPSQLKAEAFHLFPISSVQDFWGKKQD